MSTPETTPVCGLLYVDDEEKALKYFRMAFASKFEIFTASSGPEGMEILQREAGRIGIVLSDQRMPEMLGAEFLGMVREKYPFIVRILTTAFSDLDSAIQAVNTGHIYQYVVKPWEIADLGMVLQRAADYHHVLSERNELLALKMTTLQRVICSDRVKWLLLSSRSFEGGVQTAFRSALTALIKALPQDLNPATVSPGAFSKQQFEIAGLIRDEYQNAARCLESLDTPPAAVAEVVESFVSDLAGFCGFAAPDARLEIDGASNARLQLPACDGAQLNRALFGLLVERETPAVSVKFFQALVALAGAKGSLVIHSAGAPDIFFQPQDGLNAEAVIGELAEKFAATDISRM